MDTEDLVDEVSVTLKNPIEPVVIHGEDGRVGYGKRGDSAISTKNEVTEKKTKKENMNKVAKKELGKFIDDSLKREGDNGFFWETGYYVWVFANLEAKKLDLGEGDTFSNEKNKIVHKDTGIYETCEEGQDQLLLANLYTRLSSHLEMWKLSVGKDVANVDVIESKGEEMLRKYRSDREEKEKLYNEFTTVAATNKTSVPSV